MSHQVSPIELRGLTIPNRTVVAVMCQYVVENGCMHDWHLMHPAQYGVSGAGLVITAMTADEPERRYGVDVLGVYSTAAAPDRA